MEVYVLMVWIVSLLASGLLISVAIRTVILYKYKPVKNSSPVAVSVVIAARNEADHLQELVLSIINQKHPDFELIIVLDRCTDHSLDIMKQLESSYPELKTVIVDYLPDHFSPKKYALTLGIKAAKNECILMTDADCLPASEEWIEIMSQLFTEKTNFVLGYAPYRRNSTWLNRLIQHETFITGFYYLTSAILFRPFMAVGRNLIVRRSFFLTINGYNKFQHLQGGDDDLLVHHHARRPETQVCLESAAHMYSHPKTQWVDYYYQKIRHLGIGKYYRKSSKIRHTINWLVSLGLWVTFCILAIVRLDFFPLYLIFIGYILIKGLTYWLVKRKMDNGYSHGWFPVFEILHLILMPVFAIGGRVTKRVKWK